MLKSKHYHQRHRGLTVLLVGWSISLITLWHSGLWLWELNESWDPRSVAAQIRRLPAEADIRLVGPNRPSLEWYANRPLKSSHDAEKVSDHYVIAIQPPPGCYAQETVVTGDWQLWFCPYQVKRTVSKNPLNEGV